MLNGKSKKYRLMFCCMTSILNKKTILNSFWIDFEEFNDWRFITTANIVKCGKIVKIFMHCQHLLHQEG